MAFRAKASLHMGAASHTTFSPLVLLAVLAFSLVDGGGAFVQSSASAPDEINLLQHKVTSHGQVEGRAAMKAADIGLSLLQSLFAEQGLHMGELDSSTSIDGMKQAMTQLAEDVESGKTVLSDVLKAALMEIWQHMEKVFEAATIGHGEDQNEVNLARDAITKCASDFTTGFDAFKTNADSSKIAHSTCRTTEGGFLVTQTEECEIFRLKVENPHAPACMATFDSLTSVPQVDALLKCVNDIAVWAEEYHQKLLEVKGACETATGVHDNKRALCNSAQASYEGSFCSYHQELTEKCAPVTGLYAACRTAKVALRNTIHTEVSGAEESRQAEYRAGKHIQCFLGVLNATASEQENLLNGCKAADDADITDLTIDYPAIPGEAACDLSPVATKPCDGEWVSSSYTSQSWYNNANTETCNACAGASTPASTCPANCKTCTIKGPDMCDTCNDGYTLRYEGEEGETCEPCPLNCHTCMAHTYSNRRVDCSTNGCNDGFKRTYVANSQCTSLVAMGNRHSQCIGCKATPAPTPAPA